MEQMSEREKKGEISEGERGRKKGWLSLICSAVFFFKAAQYVAVRTCEI